MVCPSHVLFLRPTSNHTVCIRHSFAVLIRSRPGKAIVPQRPRSRGAAQARTHTIKPISCRQPRWPGRDSTPALEAAGRHGGCNGVPVATSKIAAESHCGAFCVQLTASGSLLLGAMSGQGLEWLQIRPYAAGSLASTHRPS
jgi:hypothetical protein